MLPVIESKNIAQKIIDTNFITNKQVLDYFTMPFMYNSYLEIVEATNIKCNPMMTENKKIEFPQTISYQNYPKIDFFPYKLPKTNVIQIWDKKDNAFIGDIKTDFLHIKISILPFIDSNIKLLFVAEIIKKKNFMPCKILNFVLEDFEKIFKTISKKMLRIDASH